MPDTPTIDTTKNVSGLGLQLGQAAAGVGGDAISAILGMVMQKHNNKVQLEQQQKLTQLQLAAEQQMSQFNYAQQYDMWKKTNYGAQVDELNNAGLNPALLYAKGGAGGQLGSGSGGAGIGAGTAGNGAEIMGLMGAKQNLATQAAQTELLKAQTNATNVHAAKEAGVDTANVQADTAQKNQAIENLKTQLKNTEANTSLTKVQTALTAIQKDITEATSLDQINMASLNAQTIQQQLLQLENQTDISNATKNTTINTIKQQYTNTVVQGVLMKSGIQLQQQQIKQITNEILQDWTNLSLRNVENNIRYNLTQSQIKLMDKETSLLTAQTIMQGVGQIMGGIGEGFKAAKGLKTPAAPAPVQGFRR